MSPPLPCSELLLKQFIGLANDVTAAASPQDNFYNTLSADLRYERALRGLRLLARHHLGLLVQTLISWRQSTHADIRARYSQNTERERVLGFCKRGVHEILFLEAALQLLDEYAPEFGQQKDFLAFYDNIQQVSFQWLLSADDLIPNELSTLRQHVVNTSARIVGAMSKVQLSYVANIFLKHLAERVNLKKEGGPKANLDTLRSQVIRLCGGMKYVVLAFNDDEQLRSATTFLRKAHPLLHTAPERKSQIHHALADMLTQVLWPLVRLDEPHGCQQLSEECMSEWYRVVGQMKSEIWSWTNKHVKHVHVGYPLSTTLVCLLDDEGYAASVDTFVDFMLKQVKGKENRSLSVRCLMQLVCSYLTRYGKIMPRPEINKWLDKVYKALLAVARKGGLSMSEQLDMISPIAELAPEYAVNLVLLELLASDVPDCVLAGLRALFALLTTLPGSSSNRQQDLLACMKRHHKSVYQAPNQVVDLLRRGQHPFELLGIMHLHSRVVAALGKLLGSWHSLYSNAAAYGNPEVYFKDKQPGIAMFCWLLRIMPYIKPDTWPGTHRVLDLLPVYTAHYEGQMRHCAKDALISILKCTPHLRNLVLSCLAAHLSSLPDDNFVLLREGLGLLRQLMQLWATILKERIDGEVTELDTPDALMLDVYRLEGFALSTLCSHDETVRRESLQLLYQVRSLHQTVTQSPLYELPRPVTALGSRGILRTTSSNAVNSGSGSGTRHGSSASRELVDVLEPPPNRGLADRVEADVTYIIEVIEQNGGDIIRACYWDFGDYSDLWQQFKIVPEDATFESLLTTTDDISRMRLARSLLELAKTVARMSPLSAAAAMHDISGKLARIVGKDPLGRPMPSQEYLETRKVDLWRNSSCMAAALPCSLRDRVVDKLVRRGTLPPRDLVRSHLSLLSGSNAPSALQLCSVMTLGHLHPEYYDILLDELGPFMEEYSSRPTKQKNVILNFLSEPEPKSSSRPKAEELRKIVAQVLRVLAENVSVEALNPSRPALRSRFVEWIRETYVYLKPLPLASDMFWDVSQVAYCLSSVLRNLAKHLLPNLALALSARDLTNNSKTSMARSSEPMSAPLRKLLYELLYTWCEEGYASAKEYHVAVRSGISQVLNRYRDVEAPDVMRAELYQTTHHLDHAARMAMAALLQGPVFDSDARRPQGPVLTWVEKLLKAQPSDRASHLMQAVGPAKHDVARTALLNMLQSNLDCFGTCLDRCYDADKNVAAGFFQVICEVYVTHLVQCEPHIMLSLILYKMVDSVAEVREDAFHLLDVLSQRQWHAQEADAGATAAAAAAAAPAQTAGSLLTSAMSAASSGALAAAALATNSSSAANGQISEPVVVLGNLQDSYQFFQLQLSLKLARDHPELSEQLCEEMMTRQLECTDSVTQHPVLLSLVPWMENLELDVTTPEWRGSWCERLLKSMYYVTLRHGSHFPFQIERLWSTLATNHRNVIPVLNFLLNLGEHSAQQGMPALLEYFSVAKRIALFLARTSPQLTVDHLTMELAAMADISDAGGGVAQRSSAGGAAGAGVGGADDSQLEFTAMGGEPPGLPGSTAGTRSLHASMEHGGTEGGANSVRTTRSLDVLPRLNSSTSTSSKSSMTNASPMNDSALGYSRALHSSAPQAQDSFASSQATSVDPPTSSFTPIPPPHPSPSPSRSPPRMSGSPRALLMRPELSLCLLTEVAYEHDEEFRRHLALLCHCCCCCLDHEELLVSSHAQQLLTNLLYSQSSRHLETISPESAEAGGGDCPQVTSLIRYLLSMRGRRLWPYEECSLLQPHIPSAAAAAALVTSITDAMFFEEDLRVRWSDRALQWALDCRSRHLSCRSLQVFRSLSPELTADVCATLLLCLQHCFLVGTPTSRDCALEVILTIKSLVERMPSGRLIVYPQIFWTALVLLHTRQVHMYVHVLALLTVVLERLKLHQSQVQNVLLASAPGAQGHIMLLASPPTDTLDEAETWLIGTYALGMEASHPRYHSLAVQQLLLKGLGFLETLQPTLRVLQQLADTLAAHQEVINGRALARAGPSGGAEADPAAPARAAASGPLAAGMGTGVGMPVLTAAARVGSLEEGSEATNSSAPLPVIQHHRLPPRADSRPGTPSAAASLASSRPASSGLLAAAATAAAAAAASSQAAAAGPASQRPAAAAAAGEQAPASTTAAGGAGGIPDMDDTSSWSATAPSQYDSLKKHRALKLDTYKTLLGPWHSQLFVSIMGLVPILLAYSSGTHETVGAMRAAVLTSTFAACLLSLSVAAASHKLTDLSAQLELLSTWHGFVDAETAESAMKALCRSLNDAFFPQYSAWFLHHCMDVLTTSSAHRSHAGVLLLLRCIFGINGLRLSSAATALLAEPSYFSPIAAMSQGTLSRPALDAMASIITFSQDNDIDVHMPESESRTGSASENGPATTSTAASTASTTSTASPSRALHPPPVNIAVNLRKVMDTFSPRGSRRRRDAKIMPFLGPPGQEPEPLHGT